MKTMTYTIQPSDRWPSMMEIVESQRPVVTYIDPEGPHYIRDVRAIVDGHASGYAQCMDVDVEPLLVWDDGLREYRMPIQP